jgi:hypothetical protein
MGGSLALGLAPNISKKGNKKDAQLVCLPAIDADSGRANCIYIYVKQGTSNNTYFCCNLSIARRLFLTSDIKSIMSLVVGTLFAKSFFAAASSNGFLCRS